MIDDASSVRLDPAPTPPASGQARPAIAVEGWAPRFRRALGVTFAVHVLGAAVSFAGAYAVARAFVVTAGPHPFFAEGFRHGAPLAPETLAAFGRDTLGPLLLAGFGMLALQALAGVPLSLVWLGVMRGAVGSLRQLPRQIARALAGGFVASLAFSLVAGLLVSLPMLWHLAFRAEVDPRLHDLGLLAALIPGLATAARWASFADHTRAAISVGAPVGEALRVGLRARGTTEYTLVVLGALCLFGLGLTLAGVTGGLFLAQLAALARSYLRALWWARAQHRAAQVMGADADLTPRT